GLVLEVDVVDLAGAVLADRGEDVVLHANVRPGRGGGVEEAAGDAAGDRAGGDARRLDCQCGRPFDRPDQPRTDGDRRALHQVADLVEQPAQGAWQVDLHLHGQQLGQAPPGRL